MIIELQNGLLAFSQPRDGLCQEYLSLPCEVGVERIYICLALRRFNQVYRFGVVVGMSSLLGRQQLQGVNLSQEFVKPLSRDAKLLCDLSLRRLTAKPRLKPDRSLGYIAPLFSQTPRSRVRLTQTVHDRSMNPELGKSAEWSPFAGVKTESGFNQRDDAGAQQIIQFNLQG